MNKKNILIVGGGFGGVRSALDLCKNDAFRVTLVSNHETFRYYPSLYHTATGGRQSESSIPLKTVFKDKNINLVIANADKLDHESKRITTSHGAAYDYDFLILSLGVVTNYFNIKGLEEYSYGIKSLEEAENLKHHLHQQLLDKRQPDLNYVVIGGGPTGIELSGALVEYLRHIMKNHNLRSRKIHIDLIEAAPRLVSRMPETVSKRIAKHLKDMGIKLYLGQTVKGETADNLNVNGNLISSHTVVWTAGVVNNPFFQNNQFNISDHGKVSVDQYLQAAPDVFVIGDNANTPFSGLAQTAIYDADFVCQNLKRHSEGKMPKLYSPKEPISAIPAGEHWAAITWGKFQFYGWFGWALRMLADLVAFHDLEPWWSATEQWMSEFGEQEECPECGKHFNR